MSSVEVKEDQQAGLQRILLWAIVAVAGVMYLPTFKSLWQGWMDNTQYSLAPLVPFVSGYFIFQKWAEVKALERTPSRLGLGIIVFALVLHLVGTVLDISGPSSLSMYLCLIGGCIYFHGSALVWTLWFPLAFIIFLLPVPGGVLDLIGFPLQLWSSGATTAVLRMTGMEVVRNGVNLSVPGFDFQVAEACSGMSSLVALIGVTAVYAYLQKLPNGYRWALFVLALPIALAANVVRITTIALAGYWWGKDIAMNIFHNWSSPIVFVAAICLLFIISRGFEWLSARRTTS